MNLFTKSPQEQKKILTKVAKKANASQRRLMTKPKHNWTGGRDEDFMHLIAVIRAMCQTEEELRNRDEEERADKQFKDMVEYLESYFEEEIQRAYKQGGIEAIKKIQLDKKLEKHYINLWDKL